MKFKAGFYCRVQLMEKLVQITSVSRAGDGCCGNAQVMGKHSKGKIAV